MHLAGDPAQLTGLLRSDGRLASTLGFGPDQHPAAIAVMASPAEATLDRLAADVASGAVRVPIGAVRRRRSPTSAPGRSASSPSPSDVEAQARHVAVFGGTGRIGHLVTEQLLAAGHDVTLLVRSPDKVTSHDSVSACTWGSFRMWRPWPASSAAAMR